jgi:hypothetical protein
LSFSNESQVWNQAKPQHLWMLDKLILAKHLGYNCGPTGVPVPHPGRYIVRPCVNALGMGISTSIHLIESSTDHLPTGHFWCEIFEGVHLSVDYRFGKQYLTVQGHRDSNDFVRWQRWTKMSQTNIPIPDFLKKVSHEYEWINCEFIGNNPIEVHLRPNPDFFRQDIIEVIPVWSQEQLNETPDGYEFFQLEEPGGRLGLFVLFG